MKNLILINSMIRFLVEVTSFFILVIVGFFKFKFPFNIVIGIILPILILFLEQKNDFESVFTLKTK